MYLRAVLLIFLLLGTSCGSRSELSGRFTEGGSVVSAQGGTSTGDTPAATGGTSSSSSAGITGKNLGGAASQLSTAYAGSAATAGNGGAMVKTIAAKFDQHWFAIGEGPNSDAQLSLVGIGDDHRISLYALPPWDTQLTATTTTPHFSESGDRFCYTSVGAGVTRVWTVALSARAALVQETKLPGDLALTRYVCEAWFSSTLFALYDRFGPDAYSPTSPYQTTLYLSTDPNETLPAPNSPIGNRSPDGRWAISVTYTADPSNGSGLHLLHLWSVSAQGVAEREVMTVASGQYTWSPNSRRLAVINGQDSGTLLTVFELSEQGQWEALDTRASAVHLYSYAGFSPDSRFLELTGTLNPSVFPLSPPLDSEWGGHVFVRDVEQHTEIDTGTTHMMKWDASGHLVEASATVPSVYIDSKKSLLEHCPGFEPLEAFTACGSPADSTFVVARSSSGGTALDFLDCSQATVRTTHLVPGVAGDGEVVADYCGNATQRQQTEYLLVGVPSYFYVTFDGPKLRHAVRLTDFFGQDYSAILSPPDGIGLLAQSVRKNDHTWLYLDQEKPGPMISFPRRINNPKFYLPSKWPKH